MRFHRDVYDKADRSFNDHLENEKNLESRGKRDSTVWGRKDSREGPRARERLRGKIRKRENLDRVLIANMTMLNSPPSGPRARIMLEFICSLLNYAPIDGAKVFEDQFLEYANFLFFYRSQMGLAKSLRDRENSSVNILLN